MRARLRVSRCNGAPRAGSDSHRLLADVLKNHWLEANATVIVSSWQADRAVYPFRKLTSYLLAASSSAVRTAVSFPHTRKVEKFWQIIAAVRKRISAMP